MPSWSKSDLIAYELKHTVPQTATAGVDREIPLHEKIMSHCDLQFPRWKYIRARSDKPSTIGVGIHDITCFLPGGRVLCIEVKTATGKLSPEQLAWMKEMEMLGHVVTVIRSFEDFLRLSASTNTPPSPG